MHTEKIVLAASVCAALLWGERGASAFCRTSTCPLPADFSPSSAGCEPSGFAQYCASLTPPVVPHPVWWRNACQSYDIQQNASKQVPYDTAAADFATAFSKWTGATCPGGGHPSIAVMDLGKVECDEVHYNDNTTGMGNQHAIIFRDSGWPYPNDLNNTLGLTTITFDPDTGEIYDADMEINSSVPLAVTDPVPAAGNDFMSIITHESGHFFGMAHSNDGAATMFAHYTPGSTYMRNLTADDATGICTVYTPSGARAVDSSVASGGTVPEDACDPTPRHGFQSACVETGGGSGGAGGHGSGCSVAGAGMASLPASPGRRSRRVPVIVLVSAAALATGLRARRRRPATRATR
jgi:hypothetical protein